VQAQFVDDHRGARLHSRAARRPPRSARSHRGTLPRTRCAFSEVHRPNPYSPIADATGYSVGSALSLQERHTLVAIDLAPGNLSPLTPAGAFVGNVEPVLASLDAAPAVGKHPPLAPLAARAERDGQENLPTGSVATHTRSTSSYALQVRHALKDALAVVERLSTSFGGVSR
jgi:hypothetical protein